MTSLVGKIQDIEHEISRTQINKQTMGHLCLLRAKLAKYKRELLDPAKGSGGGGAGWGGGGGGGGAEPEQWAPAGPPQRTGRSRGLVAGQLS